MNIQKNSNIFAFCAGAILLLEAVSTSAALELRLSGQAVYDTNQNITWIADANLAASNTFGLEVGVDLGSLSGINTSGGSYIYSDGRMNWGGAMTWINAMNANNYLGYHDWRLPTTQQPHLCAGKWEGYSLNCSGTEMGHLFYKELDNKAPYSSVGVFQPDYGLVNTGLFVNLEENSYWSATEWKIYPETVAYRFDFKYGGLDETPKQLIFPFAWAVRDGDTATVSEPTALWLLAAGLFSIVTIVCRRVHQTSLAV